MGIASKAGDWAFKAFTAGLGVTTIYLTASFSFNVYRGLAWHNAQSVRTLLLFSFFLSFSLFGSGFLIYWLIDWKLTQLLIFVYCAISDIFLLDKIAFFFFFFTILEVKVLLYLVVDWWYLYNFWTICKHSV
jgi:hypothetical protein